MDSFETFLENAIHHSNIKPGHVLVHPDGGTDEVESVGTHTIKKSERSIHTRAGHTYHTRGGHLHGFKIQKS